MGAIFPNRVAWNYTGTLDCTISPLYQYIRDFSQASAPFGAGNGIRVGLRNLFNDQNEEAKLLAGQLDLLKNHLKVSSFLEIVLI